jgi:hypothetical protein
MNNFSFRNLQPQILGGTAGHCYADWLGQIYSLHRHEGRITKRTKVIDGKYFIKEILPVTA